MPYRKSVKEQTSFVFATDLHGDNQDYDVVSRLYDFCDNYKPEHRIFGGDLFDFRAIRSGASQADKRESMIADIECGLEFLEKFRPSVFLLGNHDHRLWRTVETTEHGVIRDQAEQGIKVIKNKCRKIKCKIIPYDSKEGVYYLGNVAMVHGYAHGIHATKKHGEIYALDGGIVLHGHTHTIQQATVVRRGGADARAVGCLCRLDMDYSIHQTNRLAHANGWAYGLLWKDGYEVFQAKQQPKDKTWVLANGLTRS